MEIAPQTQAQATEPIPGLDMRQALADLAEMPEVARMVCCRHNGVGVPACPECAAKAEAFTPPTHEEALELERRIMTATNASADAGGGDRRTTKRKPRGKGKPA